MPAPPPDIPFFTGAIEAGAGAETVTFDAWRDQSLLNSMEAGGIDWPSSCRNGTCRTCLGQLVAGRVHLAAEWPGLSADEVALGYTLPCVAQPLGDVCLRRAD